MTGASVLAIAWQRIAELAARRFSVTVDDLTLAFSKTSIDPEALVVRLRALRGEK